jgi:hypothetical protein
LWPTPGAVAKLVAAWDGISTESQILILTKLTVSERPEHLTEKICMKALDSNNAYVRYLAARNLSCSGTAIVFLLPAKNPSFNIN